MGGVLFLCILLSTSAFTQAHINRTSEEGENGDSFSDATLPSSVGSVIVIVIIACLIYYCCCRNRTREGFSRFNNDNEGDPPRGRSRRRRWFRRKGRQNYAQNNVDPRQPTQVIIQPVVAVGIPTENPNFGAPGGASSGAPNMPTAPPGYDESMKNTMPNQFTNRPMPNQFVNPPMPNQFMNPPMPGNFNNPPPIPGNFNNPPPMPGNFNNPPPMPSNFNNPPPNNPNASSYYTKY